MDHDVAERASGVEAGAQAAPVSGATQSTAHAAAGAAALSRMAAAPGKKSAPAGAPGIAAGEGAFLTSPTMMKDGNGEHPLIVGTYVEIVSIAGATANVKVYSGMNGAEWHLPVASLHSEPRLGHQEGADSDKPTPDTYTRYHGPLWVGQPKINDVNQGYLGDCFLCSAMGALCAADPGVIEALFSPTTPDADKYSVTLYRRDATGKFQRHTEVVDPFLPANGVSKLEYLGAGRSAEDHNTALWPALLEKAYSQMVGGYDVAGKGGDSTNAMEAFTGREGKELPTPTKDADVLAALRGMQGKYAIAAASLGAQHATKHGFTQTSPHHFSLTLSDNGSAPEIQTGSLRISHPDTRSTAQRLENNASTNLQSWGVPTGGDWGTAPIPEAHDDGKGKLVGSKVSGTVDYLSAKIDVAYDPSVAGVTAAGLTVDYDWEGLLDKDLLVYANHAYIFESVTPDGLIHLRNPWGFSHPQPMHAADFRRLFSTIMADSAGAAKPAGKSS